eukprot:TRINITY_DN4597_c0_g3_i2.p1 TRINITY_DN4597_c0_g3~~TRINITY_DN4597_c0_g3_i2.p1  ORF type:complete len:149 (+),score=24.74 TRINITY_DN4597_c0_g3_i2:294-740(+)
MSQQYQQLNTKVEDETRWSLWNWIGAAIGVGVALTVVTVTVVVGGFLLLLFSPLLLLFSPILIPAGLFFGTVVGGLFFLWAAYWLYKYVTGKSPAGAPYVDRTVGKVQETLHKIGDYSSHTVAQVQQKAAEGYRSAHDDAHAVLRGST